MNLSTVNDTLLIDDYLENDWRLGMTLMLCTCVLLLIILLFGLFGRDCKGGPCWIWGKWLALALYFRCCRCCPRYQQSVQARGQELEEFFHVSGLSAADDGIMSDSGI